MLGATGHIGRAVTEHLLAAGRAVVAVTHDEGKVAALHEAGAEAAILDVRDVPTLRAAMRGCERAFLLNPPGDPGGDMEAEETATARAMLAALDGSGLEAVVALSTYGARAGERIGDLGVLHALERGLAAQAIPAAVVRAAYLMSNWDAMVEPAKGGVLPAMFPADFALPMVAPADVGAAAARLLAAETVIAGVTSVEGPERSTPGDVAAAFGAALGREVRVETVAPDAFEATYRGLGFSEVSAESFAEMTRLTLEGGWPGVVERGEVTLEAYVRGLVSRS